MMENIYLWQVMTRNLSHVAEEVVTTSATPSSEPIRELHSITDLSSDEKEDQFDIEISKVCSLVLKVRDVFKVHLS